MYLLNRAPSKAVQKKHLLNCGQVGNQFETPTFLELLGKNRIYNLQEKKLDARIISRYFISYPAKSKWYMFYYPSHSTRIVETRNVMFIENG